MHHRCTITRKSASNLALAFVVLPRAKRTVGRLLWWGMTRFQKPPFRTELIVQASGVHAGQQTHFEAAVAHHSGHDPFEHAQYIKNKVVPAMAAVREVADDLETRIAEDLWPLPTYREMLSIK